MKREFMIFFIEFEHKKDGNYLRQLVRTRIVGTIAIKVNHFTRLIYVLDPEAFKKLTLVNEKELAIAILLVTLPFAFVTIVVYFLNKKYSRISFRYCFKTSKISLTKTNHSFSVSHVIEPLAFIDVTILVVHATPARSLVSKPFALVELLVLIVVRSVALFVKSSNYLKNFLTEKKKKKKLTCFLLFFQPPEYTFLYEPSGCFTLKLPNPLRLSFFHSPS